MRSLQCRPLKEIQLKNQIQKFSWKDFTSDVELTAKSVFFLKNSHHKKKNKTSKKGGGNCGNSQLFNSKTHKSHQSHQVNPTSSRRGPRARPRSHRPNPRPLHRSLRNQRRGSKKQTRDRVQKRRKFRSLEILVLEFFEDVIFPCFSKPLIVFGYGCIWLFSFQLLVVWPCFCAVSTGLRPRRDLLHRLPFGYLRRLAENLQFSRIQKGWSQWSQWSTGVKNQETVFEHYFFHKKSRVFVLEIGEKNEMPQMYVNVTKPRLVD